MNVNRLNRSFEFETAISSTIDEIVCMHTMEFGNKLFYQFNFIYIYIYCLYHLNWLSI